MRGLDLGAHSPSMLFEQNAGGAAFWGTAGSEVGASQLLVTSCPCWSLCRPRGLWLSLHVCTPLLCILETQGQLPAFIRSYLHTRACMDTLTRACTAGLSQAGLRRLRALCPVAMRTSWSGWNSTVLPPPSLPCLSPWLPPAPEVCSFYPRTLLSSSLLCYSFSCKTRCPQGLAFPHVARSRGGGFLMETVYPRGAGSQLLRVPRLHGVPGSGAPAQDHQALWGGLTLPQIP